MAIGAAVSTFSATLPVELLAACYFHGEQAVANLQNWRNRPNCLAAKD